MPAVGTAGLSAHCGAQPAPTAAGPMVLRAREPPRSLGPCPGHKAFSWVEWGHSHPLPTLVAAGHVGNAMGKEVPEGPLPIKQPRAAAPAGPQGRQGRGDTPPPPP